MGSIATGALNVSEFTKSSSRKLVKYSRYIPGDITPLKLAKNVPLPVPPYSLLTVTGR